MYCEVFRTQSPAKIRLPSLHAREVFDLFDFYIWKMLHHLHFEIGEFLYNLPFTTIIGEMLHKLDIDVWKMFYILNFEVWKVIDKLYFSVKFNAIEFTVFGLFGYAVAFRYCSIYALMLSMFRQNMFSIKRKTNQN